MSLIRAAVAVGLLLLVSGVPSAAAQDPQSAPAPADNGAQQQVPPVVYTVTVVAPTPLRGVELPPTTIPAPVQTATDRDIDQAGALDLSDFLNRRLNGVHVNEVQSNPFQPDVNYRGYTASPLLGTPQGLSLYMDGVRLNQPFGDVVSWDLIPRLAISSMALMPGSNPLFGLNTLGGALSIHTKDGSAHPGTMVQAIYGSHTRRAVEFEHGGSKATGLNWYLTANLFDENGWRDDSPSEVRQFFGKVGWQGPKTDVNVTLAHANNSLTGNGLQEQQFLARDYASVYTKPDTTDNQSTFVNVAARHSLSDRLTFSGNGYYRHINTQTLNGDINEDSLDQSVYQPGAAERAALATVGYTNIPAAGLTSENTPFPFLRCLGNVLLQDEPGKKCNGLINRTKNRQHNAGLSGQFTLLSPISFGQNQFTVGGAYDQSGADFLQSTELGYLNPDRSVTGTGAFGDGVTGGDVDGEPFDTRVDLNGRTRTFSVYATDTLSVGERWHLSLSGRFNRTLIDNSDRIEPGGGPGSLDGEHTFSRLNPALGLTIDLSRRVNAYAGYSEGSRAPTSIELGCADPEQPCRLPNAMAGDPPLDQVVTRTLEAGFRGSQRVNWNVGVFRAGNSNDLLFVISDQTGFGYFKNFGKTRRQGFEVGANSRVGLVAIGAGYTFLDATFQTEETLNGESNSTNDESFAGNKGLEGNIEIEPGARVPLVPRHMLKAFAEIQVRSNISVDVGLVAISSSFARGNENNAHEPDAIYYLGDGTASGYGVVNLGGRYRVLPRVELLLQINNLFDHHYHTGAQLGPVGFTSSGSFIARPLPAINGEFPVQQGTFVAPGAPAAFWVGTRVKF